jgi:tetratricopeptide (TPR) repeat protein
MYRTRTNPTQSPPPREGVLSAPVDRGEVLRSAGDGAADRPEGIAQAAAETLAKAVEGRVVLEEFRPLAESLDWRLGQLYWNRRGSQAFLTDKVPFSVTSDGRISRGAAEVLFADLRQADQDGRLARAIRVLEVGVGAGLFARSFLDFFGDLCRQRDADYYDRLLYVATDASPQMLKDLADHGVLDAHAGHVLIRQAEALNLPADLAGPLGEGGSDGAGFHAVFLNYVLDVLPAAVLRSDGARLTRLCVRTSLNRQADLSDFTSLRPDQLLRRAASDDPQDRADLVDLYSLFSLEYEFRPVRTDELPYGEFVAGLVPAGRYALHNYGAIGCLEAVLDLLCPDGLIFISDYGQTDNTVSREGWEHQRFAGSTAIGLNFPLLRAYFADRGGLGWIVAAGNPGGLQSRLLGRSISKSVAEMFDRLFGQVFYDRANAPAEAARAFVQQGRREDALAAFAEAVRRQPGNWTLLDEIARYLIYTVADYPRGREMAELALKVNPISPDLWNTFGDALYYLGRHDEAHEAFLRALDLSPEDPRAHLNLAYTYVTRKDYGSALRMIADGLNCDRPGTYRDRLLKQQASILSAIARRRQREQGFLNARSDKGKLSQAAGMPAPPAPGAPGRAP